MPEAFMRHAAEKDVAAITRIYNHYIAHTTVTFDRDEKTEVDRLEWLRDRAPEHPVIVAEVGGRILGWASVSPYGRRPSWKHTVELGVYLDPSEHGKGLGSALLQRLVEECEALGHHALMAQIVADNAASLAMVERAGFERVGTLREVGRKFDRWLDVVIVQLLLPE